ncbi:hypothetical protein COTS27_01093 [Spirochaetota bacterium]|nr:hypothetical protein COTS27_01093 [Spirochaetota bacterium]
MIYALLTFCIISAILSYPLVYDTLIFSKEMEKFYNYLHSERPDLALKILKNLPKKKQQILEVQIAYSEVHVMKKNWYLALFHLNEIIEKKLYVTQPKNHVNSKINIHLKKAEIFNTIGKDNNAINEYFHTLELDPNHLKANTEVGMKLLEMKNYKAALTHLKQAYLSNKKDPSLAEALADTYIITESYTEALYCIKQALKHSNPIPCRLQHKEVLALFYLNQYNEALAVASTIEASYSKLAEVEIITGIIHYRLGQFKEAENFFYGNLEHYINNYSPLVIEARYLYSDILFKQCNLISASIQLSFIQKAHKTYLDTDERIAVFREIIGNEPLNHFFMSLCKKGATAVLLNKIITHDRNVVLTSSFNQIATTNIFYAKADLMPTQEKALLVFNLSTAQFTDYVIKSFIELQNKETLTTNKPINKLYSFSMLGHDLLAQHKLQQHFQKYLLLDKDKLFETIINKQIFIEREEYA